MHPLRAKHVVSSLVACVVAAQAIPLVADVIYENDFATRTSASPVPMEDWRACDYVTGLLANTNGTAPFASPPDSKQQIQDGWIRTADSAADARVWKGTSGNDNSAVVLGHVNSAGSKQACVVKQRIGNTFTSGTVEIQFDFMPPANWGTYNYDNALRRATLSFGDEAFYSPDMAQDTMYQHTAGSVGVAIHGPDGNRKRKVYYNARQDFADTNMTEAVVTQGNWLRAVVTINLDTRKWGFSMFDMGASQPAMDAATPATPLYATSDLPFADDTVTSISSIALGGIGVFWGSNSYSASRAPTHVAWFDNIHISHNGAACYENDFATRRWRTFGGTASHTYVADCLVTNRVEKEVYVVDQNLVPDRENEGTTVQPEGVDRWRRVNRDGTGNAAVKSDSNGTYLRFDLSRDGNKKNFYAFLAQPLESTFSSGKLKFSVDARLPTANYWKYQSGLASLLWVTLGSASYYAGEPSDYNNWRWAAVGIRAESDGNKVTYVPRSGSSPNFTPDSGSINIGTWYRIVIEADIEAKNYTFKVYDQGETPYPNSDTPDGTLIYTSPAIEQKCTLNTISSFSLAAYYCPVYFDNIKIWHTPTGSETETLIYSNFFTSRTIYAQNTRVAPLVGTLELNPDGQDGWTRVNNTKTGIFVDWADGNPALTFDRNDEYSAIYAVQDLGQTVKTGTLTLQADIRPPKGWLKQGDGATYVRLGGDVHRQGTLRGGDANFLNNVATGFGFKCTYAGKIGNLYTNSTIVAYRGDRAGGGAMEAANYDVVSTNWYRFVATADMAQSQYDVEVYDMGATHPTLATVTPQTPVATFTALPFRRTKADLGGISCVSASAFKTVQSLYDPSLKPMIDNLRVSQAGAGFMLIVR